MTLAGSLRRRFGARPVEARQAWGSGGGWPAWVQAIGGQSPATLDAALKNAASWACIDVIADAYSRTPFDAIRRTPGGRVPLEPAPTIVVDPSGIVPVDVWLTQIAVALLSDGNSFGQIVRVDRDGWPAQIEILNPADVANRRLVAGVPNVTIGPEDFALWPAGPIWHVAGRLVLPGTPFGLSPITYAAKTLGTTLAVEDFSKRFFDEGAHPTVVATMTDDPGVDGAREIKERIIQATRGNREPLVFGGGKLDRLSIPPGETQFLELERFCIEQVCRFWRVPPSMVYAATSGQNVTYANVAQNDLALLKYSLEGYYRRLESAWSTLLPGGVNVRANRDIVLAADATTRHAVFASRLRDKTMTVNEVRALEDEPPFGGAEYDLPGIPEG